MKVNQAGHVSLALVICNALTLKFKDECSHLENGIRTGKDRQKRGNGRQTLYDGYGVINDLYRWRAHKSQISHYPHSQERLII